MVKSEGMRYLPKINTLAEIRKNHMKKRILFSLWRWLFYTHITFILTSS